MSFKKLPQKFVLLSSVCLLAACAAIQETSIQPITVETPGAAESRCYVTVDGFRYPVTPPQTINISKSDKDLLVECVASGNRHQAQLIHPVMSKYGQAEAVTGNVPGLAWDFFSDSLYKYPDIVTIDFSHARTTPNGLPAQNATDAMQPEEYNLEEKVGGWPQRVYEKNAKPFPLIPRDKAAASDQQMIETGGNAPDKGDLQKAAPNATAATAVAAPEPAPTSGKTGLRTMPPSPNAASTPVSGIGAPAPTSSTPLPTAPAAPTAGGSDTPSPAPATSAPPQGPSLQGAAGPAPPPGPSPAATPEDSTYAPNSSIFVNPDAPASGAPTPLYPGQ